MALWELRTITVMKNGKKGLIKMAKIQMKTPLVEMDGDEMTRIIWQMIKDILLIPYVDLKTEYYDLGLVERNNTNDQVTVDSAEATKKYGVAVKCATITPNAARMTEYDLKEMWKSPNGTIRAILDGTVFRTPIIVKGITPYIPTWTKPITIARHAYGDVYKNSELKVKQGTKCELVATDASGNEVRELIYDFADSDGDVMSDMVATAYGSLAMMTSVLVSPDGVYEYEAAHGTVQRHYYKHLKGEETSTNSVATLFAWTGALRKRGELDETPELCKFADNLEKATIQTIEEGVMTGDLYALSKLENKQKVNTEDFLRAVDERLKKLM